LPEAPTLEKVGAIPVPFLKAVDEDAAIDPVKVRLWGTKPT
jgi:hypothetical protein